MYLALAFQLLCDVSDVVDGICSEESTYSGLYGNYTWPSIGGGSDYNLTCAYGSNGGQEGAGSGFAQRVCNLRGSWEEPDFTDCQSSEF